MGNTKESDGTSATDDPNRRMSNLHEDVRIRRFYKLDRSTTNQLRHPYEVLETACFEPLFSGLQSFN